MKMTSFLVLLSVLIAAGRCASAFAEPDFGPNVVIFDPNMNDVQNRFDAIFKRQERNEFGANRYACFFKPGQYDLDAQLGFYMQATGLGQSPDDVVIAGAVRSMAGWMRGNATVNFWRSAENLSIVPKQRRGRADVWAVSQGTSLRRIHVQGDLNLWDGGWSSGGFLADSKIDGRLVSGSQQQWLSRNADWGQWDGGVWNMVFVGVSNPPGGSWPSRPYTMVDQTPVIREKPYLYVDSSGKYFVMVPGLNTEGSVGSSWAKESTPGKPAGKSISIDQFFLAHSERDNSATINAALSAGKNLILTPGIYHLATPIRVTRPDTIVLGLGYATLIPTGAEPAMVISDVDGVKIGGLIFDAGPVETPSLLQVGESGASASHAANPVFLYDIVARAGGAEAGITASFVTINSNNVVGDNVWLWRADHGNGAGWKTNGVKNGLVVNGSDVTFYGLFVEHCQEYQTLWNGERGRVYFYQSEMPYDPPGQAEWSHDGIKGYASYKVADSVKTHEAFGLGIYSYFTAASVVADNAIETPAGTGIKMHNMVTIRLGGKPGSGMLNVINGRGGSETQVRPVRVSE